MKTKLSEIIIGCMSWGIWDTNFSVKEMNELIYFCPEQENTTFDHAAIYGGYTTETAFGKAFSKSGIERIKIANAAKTIHLDLQDWFMLYEASRGHKVA